MISQKSVSFVEVVTNGDTLKAKTIKDLYNANTNKLLISMYDGPEQVKKFNPEFFENILKEFPITLLTNSPKLKSVSGQSLESAIYSLAKLR